MPSLIKLCLFNVNRLLVKLGQCTCLNCCPIGNWVFELILIYALI